MCFKGNGVAVWTNRTLQISLSLRSNKKKCKTIHHLSIESVLTGLSSPVADDKGSHREADDQVDVNNGTQTWLFLQGTGRLVRSRRRHRIIISFLPSLHPTQPVEGRNQPGPAPYTGQGGRRVWREGEGAFRGKTDTWWNGKVLQQTGQRPTFPVMTRLPIAVF